MYETTEWHYFCKHYGEEISDPHQWVNLQQLVLDLLLNYSL